MLVYDTGSRIKRCSISLSLSVSDCTYGYRLRNRFSETGRNCPTFPDTVNVKSRPGRQSVAIGRAPSLDSWILHIIVLILVDLSRRPGCHHATPGALAVRQR